MCFAWHNPVSNTLEPENVYFKIVFVVRDLRQRNQLPDQIQEVQQRFIFCSS